MGLITWLDRVAGRLNRWFGATPAATQAGSPGMLTQQVSATGARVVAEEIEQATRADEPERNDDTTR